MSYRCAVSAVGSMVAFGVAAGLATRSQGLVAVAIGLLVALGVLAAFSVAWEMIDN